MGLLFDKKLPSGVVATYHVIAKTTADYGKGLRTSYASCDVLSFLDQKSRDSGCKHLVSDLVNFETAEFPLTDKNLSRFENERQAFYDALKKKKGYRDAKDSD